MTDEHHIHAAAATVRSARHAGRAAADRRAAAVTAARDLAQAARAAERAERAAAQSAASAGIHRLTAARLTAQQIAELCEISPDEVQNLRADATTSQSTHHHQGPPGPAADAAREIADG